jgi:hypothetical protein
MSWLDSEGRQIVQRAIKFNTGLDLLRPAARVKDPRVRQWFAEYLDVKNKDLSALAHSAVGQSISSLPEGFHFVSGPPDENQEIVSIEIDSNAFATFLDRLWKSRGLKVPPSIKAGKILEVLRSDAWAVADFQTPEDGMVKLWLRLEDYDTIEIWLTRVPKRNEVAIQ